LDAEPDIVAAVEWAAARWQRKVILVGSSYSASLALKIAKENEKVHAVAAFSPGEYFGKALNLGKTIQDLAKPTFITASKAEMVKTKDLAAHVNPSNLTLHTPTVDGHHGSRALWTDKPGHQEYRKAFLAWLKALPN
jgi:dienelactone hydrolase